MTAGSPAIEAVAAAACGGSPALDPAAAVHGVRHNAVGGGRPGSSGAPLLPWPCWSYICIAAGAVIPSDSNAPLCHAYRPCMPVCALSSGWTYQCLPCRWLAGL